MYIGEFWIGVFAGLIVAVCALGALAAWMSGGKK
jgi:thiol:disulfide interchange protein